MKKFSAYSIFISITTKLVVVSFFAQNLCAASFSGYTGISGTWTNAPEKKLILPMESFLTGQLEFSPFFIVRGEISLRPDNVLDTGLLNDTDTTFRVNEFSGTFRACTDYFTHFLAVFMGSYESIGSDVFMQRHFGTKPFTSRLTENWRGLSEPNIYEIRKYGISYVLQPTINSAAGVYFYTQNGENADGNSTREYDGDVRLAFSSRVFKIDLAGGIGIPLDDIRGQDEDAIFSIKSINVHYGTNMLIKPSDRFELFLQHGIKQITFAPQKSSSPTIDDDDLFVLLEPRFFFGNSSKITASLYQLPSETVLYSVFLYGVLGADISYSNSGIAFGNHEVEAGFHLGAAYSALRLTDMAHLFTSRKLTDYSFSPYLDFQFGRAVLKTSYSIDVRTDYMSMPDFFTKLTLGFKTAF